VSARETAPITFSWRLPNINARVQVTFLARVIEYQQPKDRWLCVLESVQSAIDPRTPHEMEQGIRALVGSWVFVPNEGMRGMPLPIKPETITRQIRFFYRNDPRKQ
jgi:hypothetical protein